MQREVGRARQAMRLDRVHVGERRRHEVVVQDEHQRQRRVLVGDLRGELEQIFASDDASRAVVAPRNEAALGLGFQLHYLIKRYLAAGFVVRYHAVLTAIDKVPVYLYVGPEVTFRFNN